MNFFFSLLISVCLSFTPSCTRTANSQADLFCCTLNEAEKNPYFLVIFVDAPHLDYRNGLSFCRSLIKSREHRFGHAWVYLQGFINGEKKIIEGGHSGELGILQSKYFDGIMNYIDYGYANPTKNEMNYPRYEPNPVKYLWSTLGDGFFQKGAGGHRPTCALKVTLSEEQFLKICQFIEEYNFRDYSITENQCCTFVVQIAALANLYLDAEVTMPIDQHLKIGNRVLTLWEDPFYSTITLSCPDRLEQSIIQTQKKDRASSIPTTQTNLLRIRF